MRNTRLLPIVAVLVATAACTDAPTPPPKPAPTVSASAVVAPDCPPPGVLITADRGDAAAGYREISLHLTNCGTTDYTLQGRPVITVLDDKQQPLKVTIGASFHYTADPRRITLKPGQGTSAVLSWHNIVTYGTVQNGAELEVAPVKGAPKQLVKLLAPMDLGTTGKLDTSAWL
ncbi:DUF4232 domain-containing protein [Actinoplanes sp. CA-142083]|uniref:DUF4232 domain-containing protein n=1 Tax=Actinoplanes sp. CA-142083 TaxID=3239903 RepID=UPI003D8A7882